MRMSQIIKPNQRKLSCSEQRLEVPCRDIFDIEWSAALVGEHEIEIAICGSSGFPLYGLLRPMPLESPQSSSGQFDGSTAGKCLCLAAH